MTSLRDYQVTAVQQIDAASSAIFVAPTGSGKTVIMADLVDRTAKRGERVLILTHRREILTQTSLKLAVEHGLIQAGLNLDLEHPVQVASFQTLWARCMRTNKVPLPKADLIIVDECHHAKASTWRKIIDAYPHARLIGFTATPCRGDGRGLGDMFGELIIGPQIPELINAGHLVPTKYFAPAIPNLRGVETRQGDYVINQLADRMNRADLVGDIVTQWHRLAERRRTIVFAVDIGHSTSIREEFLKAGVRAEHLDGSTPKDERNAILARLASGETELVTNCMVLTEGFDCPPVGCIVLARPTKQLGLYRQMAGRGLRPAEGKSNLILIDHSGAVHRHGRLEDEIYWTLEVDKKAVNLDHEARSARQSDPYCDCTACGHIRIRGEACDNCGFKPGPRPDLIVAKDEDLVELGQGAATYSYQDRQRWFRELMALRNVRNTWRVAKGQEPYKPGWAAAKFKDKFGAWPPFDWNNLAPATEISREVQGWVRSRDIAYAKARRAA
jgi:superfamily II DNA or RNA helicase